MVKLAEIRNPNIGHPNDGFGPYLYSMGVAHFPNSRRATPLNSTFPPKRQIFRPREVPPGSTSCGIRKFEAQNRALPDVEYREGRHRKCAEIRKPEIDHISGHRAALA